jgi:hypothetical protein
VPNLKNISGEPLYLGSPDGRLIAPGEVIAVEGEVSKDSPEDAYVIGPPVPDLPEPPGQDASEKRQADHAEAVSAREAALGQHRAYPKSVWQAVGGRVKSEGDES